MNWRERIQQWFDRPGWRRHAPAVGSVVAHVTVVAVIAGMMTNVMAEDAPRPKPEKRIMSVELVQLPEAPIEAGVAPPPRAKPEVAPKQPAPITPADKRRTNAPATSAPADASAVDDNTFYVPSSPDAPTGVAKGLASLMGDDPCVARYGPKAKECAGRELAKKTGPMDSLLPTTKEEQAKNYAAFMEKCPNWVGCEGGEWRSTSGARSVYGTRNAGGAASLGGINDLVGRLPQKPDFVDRGFGD